MGPTCWLTRNIDRGSYTSDRGGRSGSLATGLRNGLGSLHPRLRKFGSRHPETSGQGQQYDWPQDKEVLCGHMFFPPWPHALTSAGGVHVLGLLSRHVRTDMYSWWSHSQRQAGTSLNSDSCRTALLAPQAFASFSTWRRPQSPAAPQQGKVEDIHDPSDPNADLFLLTLKPESLWK